MIECKLLSLFPKNIMLFRSDEWDIDNDSLVGDINRIDNYPNIKVADDQHWNYDGVRDQSLPILFSNNFFNEIKNPNWKKLKESFIQCCNQYIETHPLIDIKNYNPSATAWYYMAESKNNFERIIHTHPTSLLSGVYYLKLNGSEGTVFYDNENISASTPEVEDGVWCIFPSNLPHSPSASIGVEPRYTIAADFYVGFEE